MATIADSVPGTTAPAKFAQLASASSGSNTIIAAVTGKRIRVLALHLFARASTNAVYLTDGTTTLYGDGTLTIPLDVTGAAGPVGICLPFCDEGWFETGEGLPLNINLGSANGVLARVVYREVE